MKARWRGIPAVAGLVAIVLSAGAGQASAAEQGRQQRTTRVSVTGGDRAAAARSLAIHRATGIKELRFTGNVASVPDDEGESRPAVVYVDNVGGALDVLIVEDGVNVPAAASGATRRRVGAVLLRPGVEIVVDLDAVTVADTSADALTSGAKTPGRNFTVGVYGFGSGKWTTIANADSAADIIQNRFNAANYNQSRQIDVDERGSGGGWGGGANISWGARLGARVGVSVENERTSPTQDVIGNRDAGGLIFEQQGTSDVRSMAFLVGPTFQLPGGVVLSGGSAITRWNVDLTHTGRLRANCPSPCLVVRTDNVSSEVRGTDVGYFVGGEYYPRDSWLGVYLSFVRTNYHDVYDPDSALAWPRDWTDSNLFAGVVIRTTNVRVNRRR